MLVHDLKNLACRLAALCQNLHERYEDPLFKRSALDVLDHTVGHLKRLAGDIRERDGHVLIKLRVDLSQVLREAATDAGSGRSSHVLVTEEYKPLPQIWGDSFLLRRAFACAIENSLEAMKGRGAIRLTSGVTRRRGRTTILVEIADDGPGMSKDFIRERMFRPFSSTKEDGLGLGVYTMAQVASMHSGSLRILSVEGGGTRVRFRFPAEDR